MYNFVDINDYDSSKPLPSEAVFFDGKCLDTELTGFKTLYVEGRESLENEFEELAVSNLDGSSIVAQRVLSRTLVIGFELSGNTSGEFEENYRSLARLLQTREDVKWSFNDERNLYYLGRLKKIEAPEAHTCRQVMKLEVYCSDPYKYSSNEKLVLLNNDNEFYLNNLGAVSVPLRYEFTFNSDNGYLGLASSEGAIELGERTELDKVKVKKNQILLDWQDFINDGTKPTSPGPNYSENGAAYLYPHNAQTLTAGPYGETWMEQVRTGNHQGTWICGTLKRLPIGTDAEGKNYAKDWTIYTKHWFETSEHGQCGEQEVAVYTADDKLIARFRIWKTDTTGNAARISFGWHYGEFKTIDYIPAWDWPFGQGERGHNRITKRDDWVEFYYNGAYYRFHDSRLRDMNATKVQIAMADHVGESPVLINRITNASFEAFDVLTEEDVANTFKAGCKLEVNGIDGKSYVNGEYRPDLEILGSQYFKAAPGPNTIKVIPSSWFNGTMTGKVYFREAWL